MEILEIFILLIVIVFGLSFINLSPNSNCTGDCNQGRNCTCKDNQDGI